MVKIFTMIKDEVDIVKDWVNYHGSLFGFNNLFIIDNYSSDGSYEALQEYGSLINLSRESDYKKKGEYMKSLIDKNCNNEIAFPMDIDEFIVYYDGKISIDKNLINNYINNLPECTIYKANYINPLITNENGYNRAPAESDYANYCDYGIFAKSFMNTRLYNGSIDHGNHITDHEHHVTQICLIHFHCRNLIQIKKKIINNVSGLGYECNLDYLINLINNNPNCMGNHHVKSLIRILHNDFDINISSPSSSNIDLSVFKNRIIDGCF